MLPDDLCDILFREAERLAPEEMCGLLFEGPLFVGVKNIAERPLQSFLVDVEEYEGLSKKHGNPWGLVHSHPGAPPNPSRQDCLLMDALTQTGHAMQMVIVGMNPRQIRSYQVEGESYRCLWYRDCA